MVGILYKKGNTIEEAVPYVKDYIKKNEPMWQAHYFNNKTNNSNFRNSLKGTVSADMNFNSFKPQPAMSDRELMTKSSDSVRGFGQMTNSNFVNTTLPNNSFGLQNTTSNAMPKAPKPQSAPQNMSGSGQLDTLNQNQDKNLSQPDTQPYRHLMKLHGFPNEGWRKKVDVDKLYPNRIEGETSKDLLYNDCSDSQRFKDFLGYTVDDWEKRGMTYSVEQPTNSGMTERTYADILKNPENAIIKKNYPSSLEKLTQDQIDNLYCQFYYKKPHAELIDDPYLRKMLTDIWLWRG